jgi:hypothetical protein
MNTRDAIIWFQTAFDRELQDAVRGTPFNIDMLSAIAYQETGYIWHRLVKRGLGKKEVLRLCVGDTIDYNPTTKKGRKAFPRNKAHLLEHPQGAAMFAVARKCLEDVAALLPDFQGAASNPNKFCRGFGIFQYDLQFFLKDADYFLKEKWAEASECFPRVIKELFEAMKRQGWSAKQTLTDLEKIHVAIAYNKGTSDLSKGLKQGHKNAEGKYYGELVSAYYDLARSIPDDPGTAAGGGPGMNVVHDTPFVPLAAGTPAPKYPGKLIVRDSADKTAVRLIQQRLRDLGFTQPAKKGGVEPLLVDGIFGRDTEDAVELFQTRHTNVHGAPLEIDGKVGSDTWGALFGAKTVHVSETAKTDSELLQEVLDVASMEVGVMEDPPGSNAGKRVQEYQRSVGISRGDAWCVAFVYWCFLTAAKNKAVTNPMEKKCRTGGVLDLWNRARDAGITTISTNEATNNPSKVKPGMVFIISTGGGKGHTGIVSRVIGNSLETIEGNTNDGGSREGIGVFRRVGRTIASINRGFIDFS